MAVNHKDTYKASAIFLIVMGILYLVDKSVGIVLAGIWLILNIGLVIALLGQMSAYLLPAALLIIGVILYLVSTR